MSLAPLSASVGAGSQDDGLRHVGVKVKLTPGRWSPLDENSEAGHRHSSLEVDVAAVTRDGKS